MDNSSKFYRVKPLKKQKVYGLLSVGMLIQALIWSIRATM